MTKKEKELAYQIIVLLRIFQKETKKQYLKEETERLIRKLEKSLDKPSGPPLKRGGSKKQKK